MQGNPEEVEREPSVEIEREPSVEIEREPEVDREPVIELQFHAGADPVFDISRPAPADEVPPPLSVDAFKDIKPVAFGGYVNDEPEQPMDEAPAPAPEPEPEPAVEVIPEPVVEIEPEPVV